MARKKPDDELERLKKQEEELKKELADARKEFISLQREKKEALRKKINKARKDLTTYQRTQRNKRLIQLGLLLEAWAEQDPKLHNRMLKDLDRRLIRADLRVLFDLEPLADAPPQFPASAIPGWSPELISADSWGAVFKGNTEKLPQKLVGRLIIVTQSNQESWMATVKEVLERSPNRALVRHSGKPKNGDPQ